VGVAALGGGRSSFTTNTYIRGGFRNLPRVLHDKRYSVTYASALLAFGGVMRSSVKVK
jgi:hypothetical protein